MIYVVDANDEERFEESKKALEKMLSHADFKGCPVLIYANKQDMLSDIFDPAKFAISLGLNLLENDRKWYIQACSARKNEGLHEGLEWLTNQLLLK